MTQEKASVEVFGRNMAYVDTGGAGDPIVFLHGNATSSYMWRMIIPHLSSLGRCIAIDNLGHGDSAKLPGAGRGSYRLMEQQVYIDAVMRKLALGDRVTLVMHDWGAQLGVSWGNGQRGRVKGLAYVQGIMGPTNWQDFPPELASLIRDLKSERGETLGLADNAVLEKVFPAQLSHLLAADDMAEYRRPFAAPGEGRRPALTGLRELPFDNLPPDVIGIMKANDAWLRTTPVPKLHIKVEPRSPFCGDLTALASYPNQTEVVVKGAHQVQEDCPDEIGRALADWYRTLG